MNILGLLWLVGYAAIFKGFAYPTVYGEVGGEVLFLCPCDKERPVNIFYFQGGHGPDKVYINGWHAKNPTKPNPDLFTSVNRTERTVTMWNLTAGNEGFYQFFIDYSDEETKEYIIFLNVSEKTTTTRSGEQQPIHSSEAEQSHRHRWYFLAAGCLFVLLLFVCIVIIILHVVATHRQHSAPGASPSGASGGAPEEP